MTGEYMTFVDSDDFLHPQFFEILWQALQATGADIAAASFLRVFEETPVQIQEYSFSEKSCDILGLRQACKSNLLGYCCSKLILCKAIGKLRFKSDCSFGEDTIFFLELMERNPSLRILVYYRELYYYYCSRADSLSNSNREKSIMSLLVYLREKAASKSIERIYLETSIRRCLYFRYHFTYIQKNLRLAKEIGKLSRSHIFQLLRSKKLQSAGQARTVVFYSVACLLQKACN